MKIFNRVAILAIVGSLSSCSMLHKDGESVTYQEDGVFGESDPAKLAEHALSGARSIAKSERAQTLETYFKQGNYKEAAEMAADLRALSDPASEDLDVAEFILGVSSYYLGDYEKAEVTLANHLEGFPQSRHRESSAYYRGGNLVKLNQWRAAGESLDTFLARYPESILMEYALYDRALCHFEMQENEQAVTRIDQLETGFVYSKIRDRALALKGDILAQSGKFGAASVAYNEAAATAKKLNHSQTHARSLRGLIAVNAAEQKWGEGATHYKEFFKLYSNSPQAIDAAVAGMPVMDGMGRVNDGLKNLETELMALPANAPAIKMNQALRTYAKYYGEKNGPEKLLSRFDNLSSGTEEKKRLHEQIVVARLEVLEDYFPNNEAEIRVFYDEVDEHFAREDLSTETLVKLARHVGKKNKPKAQLILEEALERPGSEFQDIATLEHSKILAESGDPRERHLAMVGFQRVLSVFGNPELAEEATLGMARLYSKDDDWTNAYGYWDAYLKNGTWTSARDEAKGQFAIAKEKAGPLPVAPVNEVDPLLAQSGLSEIEKSLLRANKMVEEGQKPEAFEMLAKLIEAADKNENLSKEDSKALRKATVLQQDLAVELGLGARLVED